MICMLANNCNILNYNTYLVFYFLHESKEYHNFLRSNLIYLEGNYDDEMYHFGIALERQSLNNGSIRERIRRLEEEIADSPLLKYDKYANTTPI